MKYRLKHIKIRSQFMLAILILAAIITVTFSSFFYALQRNKLIEGIDNKLYTAALMAREILPADYHDRIINKNSVSLEEYESIVTKYNQICKSLDLEYLWSLMQIDGKIVFTSATSPDKITENKKYAGFFELHSNPELYVSTFLKMTPTYQTNNDKWGDIRVVLIPFKDISGRPYLFGASMSLAKVNAQLKNILLYCILIGFSIFLTSVILSYFFAVFVTRPIKNLAETIKNNMDKKKLLSAREEGSYEQVMLTKNFNLLIRELDNKITELAITDRRNIEERLKQQTDAMEATVDGMAILDAEGKYIYLNEAHVMIYGYDSPIELIGKSWSILYDCDELKRFETDIMPKLSENGHWQGEAIGMKKDRSKFFQEISLTALLDRGLVCIVRDITERKNVENKIIHLSYHDQLTGLYNRRFFEEEIKRLDTKRQLPLGFIMGDLNGLKIINDTFGHGEGDLIIKQAAEILKKVCREDDIIARWGGDEFVVLLPKTTVNDAEEIVKRIKIESKKTVNQKIIFSISLGTGIKVEASQEIQAIIIEAENNMYKNKLVEKESLASSIIFALEQALYEKSNETKEHTERVKELAIKLGKSVKLHAHQLAELSLLASLHDIGKVAISDEILMKEGKLTEKELEAIERHSEIGFKIAQSSQQITHIAKYILACHENWDGSGYPNRLKKESIPLISRITLIADSYDAMISGRQYKKPMSKAEIIKELRRCSGTQFDPILVEKFIEILSGKSLSLF